ncbi:MAG: creatininase family protein [Acidimicrobiales bacterium]|nr:creatininase family protein [Acidimicrobiales bacterium]
MVNRRLEHLSAPAVAERVGATSTIVWPIGAVEQHGPHLPLSVDHIVADAVAEAIVERCGDRHDLWLLPTLSVSKSDEHAWSPGTLWLSATTLLSVVTDIGGCVASTGARRLLFLNAHGGNTSLLQVACRELRRLHGLATFLTHPFVPADHGGASAATESGMGIHGGHDETSLMLHLRPELVDMTLAERCVPDHLAQNSHVRFGGTVSFGWLSDDFGPSGHIGDPTGATAAEGERLFLTAIDLLEAQLDEIVHFDPAQNGSAQTRAK